MIHVYNFQKMTIFLSMITILSIFSTKSVESTQIMGYEDKLTDFHLIRQEHLEQGWRHVVGTDNSNIMHLKEAAKLYNINPIDLACILLSDTTSRFAWSGGMPHQIPYGFTFSHSGISQIPPEFAVSQRLIRSDIIVPGARYRYQRYTETTLEPQKGVDYWVKALTEESYEAMKNPLVNIFAAARCLRRVYDRGFELWVPDARDSINLDDKNSLLPKNYIRWADEFDWRQVRNYMRNHMLWDYSYEFDLTEFHPENKNRISELNAMLVYSEYRTQPSFDGSWFFEAMYLARETRRWLDSRTDIIKLLELEKNKPKIYVEFIEDYSFYQDEFEILNPFYGDYPNQNSSQDSEDSGEEKPKGRRPRR